MWQSVKVSNVFNTLTLKQIFWKMETFFKKLEYHFLVETSKIENTLFPFKTALSEVNRKTNRMATIKWAYHKQKSVGFCLYFWTSCCKMLKEIFRELILRTTLIATLKKFYSCQNNCFLNSSHACVSI